MIHPAVFASSENICSTQAENRKVVQIAKIARKVVKYHF